MIHVVKGQAVGSNTSVDQMGSVRHVDGIKRCVVKGEYARRVMRVVKMDCAISVVPLGPSVVRTVFAMRDTYAIPITNAKRVGLWIVLAAIKVSVTRGMSVGMTTSAYRVDGQTAPVVQGIHAGRDTSAMQRTFVKRVEI